MENMNLEIYLFRSFLHFMQEKEIDPTCVEHVGYEDGDFYVTLRDGNSHAFNPYTERER